MGRDSCFQTAAQSDIYQRFGSQGAGSATYFLEYVLEHINMSVFYQIKGNIPTDKSS